MVSLGRLPTTRSRSRRAREPLRPGRAAERPGEPRHGGVATFRLLMLSLLYFFDEFDTAAFGVLAPDIQKAFNLSDGTSAAS